MSPRLIFVASSVAILGSTWMDVSSTRSPATTYVAMMAGSQETPPNGSKATGTATFMLDDNKLSYTVVVKDLTEDPTAAHIHVGAAGVAGPPIFTFTIKSSADKKGTVSEGTLDLSREVGPGVSGDSLKALLKNGSAYVNVHTKNFPDGETRGQIIAKP